MECPQNDIRFKFDLGTLATSQPQLSRDANRQIEVTTLRQDSWGKAKLFVCRCTQVCTSTSTGRTETPAINRRRLRHPQGPLQANTCPSELSGPHGSSGNSRGKPDRNGDGYLRLSHKLSCKSAAGCGNDSDVFFSRSLSLYLPCHHQESRNARERKRRLEYQEA